MSGVRLLLLGPPRFEVAGEVHPLPPERRFQLLAYLACRRAAATREHLASLFWPDRASRTARTNLRYALLQLKQVPWLQGVAMHGEAVRADLQTDVTGFEEAVRGRAFSDALALYQGPLLEGYEAEASPAYIEWLRQERARLQSLWRDAALESLALRPADADALRLWERLLGADPLDEPVLQGYLRALAQTGQRTQAQRVYREFAQRLADELGIEPSNETRELHRSLEPGRSGATASIGARPAAGDEAFLGRIAELRQLAEMLAQEDCRLVTIVGPGGIGKSRLTRQALPDLAKTFGRTCNVALEDLADARDIGARMARALQITLQGAAPALEEVIAYLGDKSALLVLDNFEHLMEGSEVVAELRARCSNLKLIVTSRTRLALPGEWLLPLDGLPFPLPEDEDHAEQFDAVRLFIDRARRFRPDFAPRSERAAMAEIARRVEGLPLALELAAAWTRVLPCAEIAAELRVGSELLHAADPSRPPRQAGIDTMLEQSWRLLVPREQQALARLAIFAGSFSREAASEVAGASLPLLASLVDKSWVRAEGGRFSLHPLLQQFAAAKLASSDLHEETKTRHLDYFRNVLARLNDVVGAGEADCVNRVELELENLRLAWQNALARGDPRIFRYARPLAIYFDRRGRFADGVAFFLETERRSGPDEVALGPVLRAIGWLEYLRANVAEAERYSLRALQACRAGGDALGVKGALSTLGFLNVACMHLDAAAGYLGEALDTCRAAGDDFGVDVFTGALALVYREQGDYERALQYVQRALEYRRRSGDVARLVEAMHSMGAVLLYLGRPAEALAILTEGSTAARAPALAFMRAGLEVELAWAYCDLGQYDEARRIVLGVVSQHEGAKDDVLPHAELALVRIGVAQGALDEAAQWLVRATRAAIRSGYRTGKLACAAHRAGLLAARGQAREAAEIVSLVHRHPEAAGEHKVHASRFVQRYSLEEESRPFDAERDNAELDRILDAIVADADPLAGTGGGGAAVARA